MRRLPGLLAPVVIRFGPYGVPWIRAQNDVDAAEALGYVHARDRMAQMDLMRRIAGGTLAALIGPAGLRNDRWMRTLGTARAADAAYVALPPHPRAILLAYARGVNAWISARGRFSSPEALLLGRPRPWEPTDSLLWGELMGLYLSGNLRVELARLALERRLSPAQILALWPGDPGAHREARAARPPDAAEVASATSAAMPRFPQPISLPWRASNGWAVAGVRTRTGAPLLAGDPHLGYGLPCFWYLVRIDTADETLAGATAPGVPFLVLGRNRDVAWTFTQADADTEDVVIERRVDAEHYLGPNGPLPFSTRTERIEVRGHTPVLLTVRSTRHGPLISDLGADATGVGGKAMLAASVASLQPGNTSSYGFDMLDRARDMPDLAEAASRITAPVLNLIVADRAHIALFTTGRVPLRRSDDGRLPTEGWTGAGDWIGDRAGSTLPHLIDPSGGVVVNANEPVDVSGPALSGDTVGAWRARRIRDVLAAAGSSIDVATCVRLQSDVTSEAAQAVLPRLRATTPADELSRRALALLAEWDGREAADLPQPLIVAAWLTRLEHVLAVEKGDPSQTATAPLDFLLTALLSDPSPAMADRLSRTLSRAMRSLAQTFGDDPSRWRWGAAHRAIFGNPLWDQVPVLGWWRHAAPPVGGDDETVDAQAFTRDGTNFPAIHGAAFRGVYDLGDLDRSRYVIATGESGNPFSTHLLDLLPLWTRGQDVELGSAPVRITGVLTLRPAR